jgi:hypothetical protein
VLQEYFMWVRMKFAWDDHGCAVRCCIISCTRDGFESWGEFVAVKLISSIIASELEIQLCRYRSCWSTVTSLIDLGN